MEKKFTKVYTDIKTTSRDLVDISEALSEKIDRAVVEYDKIDTLKFCIVTFTAIFLFATAPALLSYYYEFSTNVAPVFKSYLSQLDYIQSNSFVKISSFFVFIAVPSYTLLFPYIPKFFIEFSLFKKGLLYYSYTFALNYLVLLIPLMYLASYQYLSDENLIALITVWLCVPGLLFALIPSFFVIIFLSILFAAHRVNGDKSNLIPFKIMHEIILLLRDVNAYELHSSNPNSREHLSKRIDEIAFLVRSMPLFMNGNCSVESYVSERFKLAAKAIKSLKLCVLFPDGRSKKILKRKCESIFNTFATENYMNLPKVPYINYSFEEPKKYESSVKRFVFSLSIASFFTAPLILWAVLVSYYNPTIPMPIQSILPVLYSVWCLIVLISFSEKLAPDARAMIVDVFKFLLTKK